MTSDTSPFRASTGNQSFWATFLGTVRRPWSTLLGLQEDPHAARKGILALAAVTAVYTLILGIFVLREYPAMAPSVLPFSPEEQYRYQIWYQGPMFLLTTLVIAAILTGLMQLLRGASDLGLAFARLSLASTVPFAFTTMLVEVVIALLILVGIVEPTQVLSWLGGPGRWFPALYQSVGIIWIWVLFALTIRLTLRSRWIPTVLLSLGLLIIYGLPIGLFIR